MRGRVIERAHTACTMGTRVHHRRWQRGRGAAASHVVEQAQVSRGPRCLLWTQNFGDSFATQPRGGPNTRRQTHALPHSMNKRQPRPCLRFPHGSAKARVRRLSERRERGERVEAVDERLRRLSRSKSWMIKVEAWAPPIRTDARGQGHSTRARRATGREPASQRGRSGGRCMREAAQGRRSDDTSRRTAPSKPPVG